MRTLLILILAAGLAVFVFMYACNSRDTAGRTQPTAIGMEELRVVAATAKAKTQAVGKSAQAIADSAKSGPAAAFAQFKLDVEALKGARDALFDGGKSLQTSVAEFFTDWEKGNAKIVDEQLRRIAEGRRAELQLAFTSCEKATLALRATLDPYVVSVEDLERYLTSDLTPAGIAAIDSRIRAASKDAGRLDGQFQELDVALGQAAPKFKVAKPAPEK
jgi:hypothetical protein